MGLFESNARAQQVFRKMDRDRGIEPRRELSPTEFVGSVLLTILAFIAYVWIVTATFGCAPTSTPLTTPNPESVAVWTGYCRALWQDELGRDIGDGLGDCITQLAAGRSVEDERAMIRASAEYAARQQAIADAQKPTVRALHVAGRGFATDDGQPWLWKGITAFRLVQMVASGDELGADDYLAWCADHDVSIVRTLAMAWNLFRLDADGGRAALPRLLELAERHGLHVEVVALADTAAYTFDRRAHVQGIGAICAAHPSCLVELANEPVHPSQAPEVGDPAYLRSLAALVPAGVLRALGPAGATIAEADTRFLDGSDYMPIHEERQDDGSGVRWVRHLADLREISERVGKPVVNDEPQRDDMSADNHAGAGALARVFGLGDTFHSQSGLGAAIPTGHELEAFEGRRAGWNAIPRTWTGGDTYCNAGFAGCPITGADWNTVVKVYGTVAGAEGYEVAVGVKGSPGLAWAAEWPTRELLLQNGRSWAWRVTR